jgi:hypothetical protein
MILVKIIKDLAGLENLSGFFLLGCEQGMLRL